MPFFIDNADLPTSTSLDSRADWEAGLMRPLALGRGCMGVTRRSRCTMLSTGANRCRLYGTPEFTAEALRVHLPSDIYIYITAGVPSGTISMWFDHGGDCRIQDLTECLTHGA